jgi:hypothetical protein
MSRWSDLAAERDRAVRALGHAALCAKARQLMPHLDHETANAVRAAMLAGPGCGLRELVIQHWRAA